jgi:hypothetical protein
MIFIVLLAYITCTTNQHTNKQNNNLLISTDGYDIKTVMQDLKKFIIKDFPDLYEKMKKEEDIDNEKVVSKKYKPKIDSLKNYRKLLLDPYSKERSKKMKQANIKDFQYIQTEEGKVFLILN